jgi:hypothetical protein
LALIQAEFRSEARLRKNAADASALPACSGAARSKFSTKPDQDSRRRRTRSNLDLIKYRTFRGAEEQPPKPALSLPAALLHVNLILPRFSEAGPYTIIVVACGEGTNRIA